MMDGDYQEAIESSRRALCLGQAIGSRRLQGLAAVALAEAMRRSVGPGTLPALPKKIRVLEEAFAYAQQALEQFKQTGEQIYLIQSLIEKGCNRRNLVHICVEHPELEFCRQTNIDDCKQESANYLREAAQKAQAIGHTGLQLDALVNLGWLGYFAKDDELVTEATQAVRQAAAALYLHPAAEHPQVTEQNRHLGSQWEQMAKHYTMRGGQAYRAFQQAREKGNPGAESLKEAGRFWTYSIFFNAQKGENFDNFRRAKNFIYQRLRSLNDEELRYVISGVEEVEREIGQNRSGMRAFMETSFLWPSSP
jgi:tetratricopeptide (TPR) repeat protein